MTNSYDYTHAQVNLLNPPEAGSLFQELKKICLLIHCIHIRVNIHLHPSLHRSCLMQADFDLLYTYLHRSCLVQVDFDPEYILITQIMFSAG